MESPEIKNYLDNHKDDFFKKYKERTFIKIENEEAKKIDRIDSLKEEIKILYEQKEKVDKLEDNKEIEIEILKSHANIKNKEIIELESKIKNKKELLSNIENKYYKYKNLNEFEERIKELESEDSFLQKSIRRNENLNEKLNENLKLNENKLLKKMVEVKTIFDALMTKNKEEYKNKVSFQTNSNLMEIRIISDNRRQTQEKYILEINENLLSLGRNIEYIELVNIIVSIAQSQFTLFSGLPGTGKTSLAKLLSQAMGLNKRFLNIPISKGWTSPRDIFGFYNTLSQTFQASPSELYHMLSDIQSEDASKNAPIIVLLDEFNLSQPEHYFSSFLEISDPESERYIKTGDPKKPSLYIPEYMKFLCTINNDDSVQSLTPRMIDRSAIIHFSQPSDDDIWSSLSNKKKVNLEVEPISANDFIDLFRSESVTPEANIANLLSKISSELSKNDASLGNNIILSYRKYISIGKYCNVAGSLLADYSELAAFDLAFSQHIYPLLNGFGEGFGKRLDNLKNILPSDMEISRKNLENLINIGKNNLYSYRVIS